MGAYDRRQPEITLDHNAGEARPPTNPRRAVGENTKPPDERNALSRG